MNGLDTFRELMDEVVRAERQGTDLQRAYIFGYLASMVKTNVISLECEGRTREVQYKIDDLTHLLNTIPT
jgi:hypothetical protein